MLKKAKKRNKERDGKKEPILPKSKDCTRNRCPGRMEFIDYGNKRVYKCNSCNRKEFV